MADAMYEAFGRRVRARRDVLRLTQGGLAGRVGLSRASIANIEAGRQAVLLHQFLALAEALEIEPLELVPQPARQSEKRDLPDVVRKFLEIYEPENIGIERSGQ